MEYVLYNMVVCETCGKEYTRQDSLTRHINNSCSPPGAWDKCATCKNYYSSIGKHYQHNRGHEPNITPKQRDIIIGSLMGDASIVSRHKTPRYRISVTQKDYIDYLSNNLGGLVSNVAEESVREDRQQRYSLHTISHTGFSDFSDWYSTESKVFPDKINMSPTILKHWYVTDGNKSPEYDYPSIRAYNEEGNSEKICSYFDDTPLNTVFSSSTLRFPSSKYEFFNYIGEPLPGFEYKWPNEFR